jgi:hypothetical protein
MLKKRTALALAITASFSLAHTARADEKAECLAASEKAQQLKDDRKFIKAREQFLVCARDVCPAAVKKDCADQVAELDKKTPSVVFHAKDKAGQDLVAVKVTADGAALTEQLDGRSITLDPGVHTFRFEAAGNDPLEQKIVLAEGERDRAVTVNFGKGVEAGPGGGGHKSAPIAAFVVSGIGLVAMGVGGAFWGIGLGQKGTDEGPGGCKPNCSQAEIDDIHTKLVIGDIVFFGGVAVLAGGLIWTIVHYASGGGSKEGSAQGATFDIAPTVYGRGAVASTTIRW